MHQDRVAVSVTVAIVGLLTLATGPSVSLLAIPNGGIGAYGSPGSGNATLTVVDAPDRAEIAAGEYGEVFYLTVPGVAIRVSDVTGAPILTQSVDIDDLGYSRSTVFVLSDAMEGTRTFTIERDSIEADWIDAERFDGRLRLTLRDDRGRTIVYEAPIEIEVNP